MTPSVPGSTDSPLPLDELRSGDREAIERLLEPYRRELRVHCYRMLGSYQDAEDMVQETFLRAWRGRESFEGRASLRYWMYRIATNACLNAIAARSRRLLPETVSPPSEQMPDREPASEIAWLEPYPDHAFEGLPDEAPGPDVRYERREAVSLAFVAAIQFLPPRQRAALLLQDVLGWSASESARLLDSSVASVRSALQRARRTLEERLPGGKPDVPREPTGEDRELLERYLHTWESGDVEGFTSLLTEDAAFSMPPWRQWYRGRSAIATFFAFTTRPGGHAPFRLLPTAANGGPAFAFYSRWQGPEWRFHSIQLVSPCGHAIHRMVSFVMPALAPAFHLPRVLAVGPPEG